MHYVVTGGAGFIGSHLVEQLLLEGHRVTVIDNLSTGQLCNLPNHNALCFLHKDVCQCQPTDFAEPIDGIAHLAASPSVIESWSNPFKAHHNTLSSTIAAIQLCQALSIPRFVLASSAAVYGNSNQLPLREDQPTVPISPYGLQKLTSEQYTRLFANQFGFSCVILRLFNVFGSRQSPTSSYLDVISRFLSAMQQNLPITIYGDGSQTRDFIYVKDVAIAFLKALAIPLAKGTSLTCNVGTGTASSLLQSIAALRMCVPKWQPQIHFNSPRDGDIQNSQADVSKALLLLNFQSSWDLVSALQHFSQCPQLKGDRLMLNNLVTPTVITLEQE